MYFGCDKPKDKKTHNFGGEAKETNPDNLDYMAEGERNSYSFGVTILNETKPMYSCVCETEVNMFTLALHS